VARVKDIETLAKARIKEIEARADKLTQRMESSLAQVQELTRRAQAKLK
jgi:prefoldin subunit 5